MGPTWWQAPRSRSCEIGEPAYIDSEGEKLEREWERAMRVEILALKVHEGWLEEAQYTLSQLKLVETRGSDTRVF